MVDVLGMRDDEEDVVGKILLRNVDLVIMVMIVLGLSGMDKARRVRIVEIRQGVLKDENVFTEGTADFSMAVRNREMHSEE